MSQASAVAFYERLERDPEFAERLGGLTVPEVERLVKGELGYDFTKEEMQAVLFERHPEMTDEEMEAVVGGFDVASFGIGMGSATGAAFVGIGLGVVGGVAIGAAVAAAA